MAKKFWICDIYLWLSCLAGISQVVLCQDWPVCKPQLSECLSHLDMAHSSPGTPLLALCLLRLGVQSWTQESKWFLTRAGCKGPSICLFWLSTATNASWNFTGSFLCCLHCVAQLTPWAFISAVLSFSFTLSLQCFLRSSAPLLTLSLHGFHAYL